METTVSLEGDLSAFPSRSRRSRSMTISTLDVNPMRGTARMSP
jgi:hypothetical protein